MVNVESLMVDARVDQLLSLVTNKSSSVATALGNFAVRGFCARHKVATKKEKSNFFIMAIETKAFVLTLLFLHSESQLS